MLEVSSTGPGIFIPVSNNVPSSERKRKRKFSGRWTQTLMMFLIVNTIWLLYFISPYYVLRALLSSGTNQHVDGVILAGLFYYCVYRRIKERSTCFRGVYFGRKLRHAGFWRKFFDYFPVRMFLSDELVRYSRQIQMPSDECIHDENNQKLIFPGLPANQNYILGYHPHGLLPWGVGACFATEAIGFSKIFPGLNPWCAVHPALFSFPVVRELGLSVGMMGATYNEMRYRLDSELCEQKGNLVSLVVGGGMEMLESRFNRYTLYLNKRFGLCKLALQTGSSLIPCISFDETKTYKVITAQRGTLLRRIQEYCVEHVGIPLSLFYGLGLAPFPSPIYVVGAPIPCSRTPSPTRDQIAKLKSQYVESLVDLFERYKSYFDPAAGKLELI